MARGGAARRVRLGPAQDDLPPEPRRPRRAPLLAADRGGTRLPAAGLPWFMTMFGRDSIFTSLQALPFTPELAATTLRALGDWQGVRRRRLPRRGSRPDPPRDALRRDDRVRGAAALAVLRLGRCDAALRRAARRVRALDGRPRARARARGRGARRAQLDRRVRGPPGHGYIWYQRRNEKTGLENQCWKDSWDSISFRDGTLPGFPRATCELQGYAYDAKVRGARLARVVWKDDALADKLEQDAADLKRRFNRDYWVEDGEYFALALDPDGSRWMRSPRTTATCCGAASSTSRRRRRSRGTCSARGSSPAGACARSPKARAATTRSATTSAPSGRSTTRSSPGVCVATASRTRRREIASGILDAAEFFDGRLPEAFGGYARAQTKYPVQYPTACSPQAWSTGTPLLLLRTMLGLEPHGEHLVVDPALPSEIGHLELLDIPGRWGRIDAFGRGRVVTRS